MTVERRREVASRGGQRAHESGKAHEFTSEEARLAGKKGGKIVGDGTQVICGISGIKEAAPGDLTFLANPKYAPLVQTTRAGCVLLAEARPPLAGPQAVLIR